MASLVTPEESANQNELSSRMVFAQKQIETCKTEIETTRTTLFQQSKNLDADHKNLSRKTICIKVRFFMLE